MRRSAVTVALGAAQTLAWASSYYLPAMLAPAMARDLGVQTATVFAAFSVALVVSALVGPRVGAAIDRRGGRPVLVASSLLFAAGLAGLGLAAGPVALFAAWALLGVAMAAGLYDAAFSALVHLHGHRARAMITGVTLFGGFASTVGWPLSAWLDAQFGWRVACFTWAGLHLLVGLPLHAWLPRRATPPEPAAASTAPAPAGDPAATAATAATAAGVDTRDTRRSTLLLSFVFAVTWFTSTAMAAHLPRVLQAAGATLAVAVFVGALIGPAQVAARLLEFGLLRRVNPLISSRIASTLHPVGAALLWVFGAPAAAWFGVLHGAGNGIMTIAKGTLPLALFGERGYGRRQGVLSVPARIAQAAAPWLFGLALDRWGAAAIGLTAGLGVLSLLALLALRRPQPAG